MEVKKKSKTKHYSTTEKDNARRYYILGLNLNEVSKLTEIPEKTLERWQQKHRWVKYRDTNNIKTKAVQLKESGLSNKDISDILQISLTTVWRYCNIKK